MKKFFKLSLPIAQLIYLFNLNCFFILMVRVKFEPTSNYVTTDVTISRDPFLCCHSLRLKHAKTL